MNLKPRKKMNLVFSDEKCRLYSHGFEDTERSDKVYCLRTPIVFMHPSLTLTFFILCFGFIHDRSVLSTDMSRDQDYIQPCLLQPTVFLSSAVYTFHLERNWEDAHKIVPRLLNNPSLLLIFK